MFSIQFCGTIQPFLKQSATLITHAVLWIQNVTYRHFDNPKKVTKWATRRKTKTKQKKTKEMKNVSFCNWNVTFFWFLDNWQCVAVFNEDVKIGAAFFFYTAQNDFFFSINFIHNVRVIWRCCVTVSSSIRSCCYEFQFLECKRWQLTAIKRQIRWSIAIFGWIWCASQDDELYRSIATAAKKSKQTKEMR